jgi:hypothetical protein
VNQDFCSNPWRNTWQRYADGRFPKADRERIETQCFKSAWVSVALHEGLGAPRNDQSNSIKLSSAPETVHGKVVHWTVGALLYRTRFLPLRYVAKMILQRFIRIVGSICGYHVSYGHYGFQLPQDSRRSSSLFGHSRRRAAFLCSRLLPRRWSTLQCPEPNLFPPFFLRALPPLLFLGRLKAGLN